MKNVKGIAVFEDSANTVTPGYALHPYQRQVLRDILVALDAPEKRAIAHLPTGAGKTRIAAHVVCRLLNGSDTENSLVIWLASTEELCEQAVDSLSRAWGYLGLREIAVHRYWGNQRLDLRRLPSGFLVTGLTKLRSVSNSDNTVLAYLASSAAGIIFDEAHQAVAPTYRFVTEQLCSTRPPLLGLTATPGRTANVTDADYQLADMFNHKKISIDPKGHDNPVSYLIENRYLADPRFVPVRFDSDVEIADPQPGMDYTSADLESLGASQSRTAKIVELAEQASKRHSRTIVFCPSVESAEESSRLLSARGVGARVITASTPPEERRAIIDDFRGADAGSKVLLNYGVLTAGFDAPRTRCVIIARPTTSLVLYSQMAGRAMRGPRSGGNTRAEIMTVADTNLLGFGSVTEAFTNWEELWTSS